MASIFTQIVQGEVSAYKIAETDKYLAFLDVSPVVRGHTLVIPKEEVATLWDLDEETYLGLQVFTRLVARAIRAAIPCMRVAEAVIGLEVPHAHIHLFPVNTLSDFNFSQPRVKLSETEFKG
ncbi:MAG: HIT family protein, partial [Sphingobacteriia bacterium]